MEEGQQQLHTEVTGQRHPLQEDRLTVTIGTEEGQKKTVVADEDDADKKSSNDRGDDQDATANDQQKQQRRRGEGDDLPLC